MSDSEKRESEARAILEAAEKFAEAQHLVFDQVGGQTLSLVAVPRGFETRNVTGELEALLDAPRRRCGTARVATLASFIDHVNRFKAPESALFCDPAERFLMAMLNYHHGGPDGAAQHGDHRCVYQFPVSEEWKAWTSPSVAAMDQRGFAEFLEEHLLDITDPASASESATAALQGLGAKLATPAELLTLSRNLIIRAGAKITRAVNLSSGEGQLSYEEAHSDEHGGPLRIPGGFVVAIPVFARCARYQLPVRLRYRVRGDAVTWSLQVHRADLAFDDCIEEACTQAAGETGLPLFYGQPEHLDP